MPFGDDDLNVGDLTQYLANIDPQSIRRAMGVGTALAGSGPAGQRLSQPILAQTDQLLKQGVTASDAMVRAKALQNVANIRGGYGLEQQGMKNVSAESIADKKIRAAMLLAQAHGNEFYVDPQGNHFLQNKITGTVHPVPAPGPWMTSAFGTGENPTAAVPSVNVNVNTGGQPQGSQWATPKNLTPSQQKDVAGFDAAENRLNMLENFIKQNPDVKTYKGAALAHSIAQMPGLQGFNDPRFGQLETLSGEHLLKGIKSDVGGRISNFEIKYGEGIFPNTNLGPQENLARIQTIRSLLRTDKENYLATAQKSGQRTAPFQGGQAPAQGQQSAPTDRASELRAKYGL